MDANIFNIKCAQYDDADIYRATIHEKLTNIEVE